jgi:GNAT superfamily N-acetyltransferase
MIEAEVQASQPVPASVEEILRDLPERFGIEEALADYVDQATELPTYTAVVGGQVQGVCLVRRHSPYSAEVSLLAVRRSIHRQGLGRALMAAAEQHMKADGVGFMQVKTL